MRSRDRKGDSLEQSADRANGRFPALSLVIPAYNEAHRIASTLHEVLTKVPIAFPHTEIILVDDGSSDETLRLATGVAVSQPRVQVIAIPHGGKAAAVRAGMLAATGDLIVFSDADLATPLTHLIDLALAIERGCDIAIGSREGIGAHRIGEPAYRHVMGRGFNWLVRLIALPGLSDTQCGFKMFRRDAAREILSRTLLYPDGARTISGPRVTAFDVELLVIARRLSYRTCSVPVTWRYGSQSKVDPARDTWHNLLDVLKVRYHDLRGRYR